MHVIDWLSELVSCDTTSRNSNLELIKMLAAYFKEMKIDVRLTYSPDAPKANLLAVLPAKDGSTQGGIILSGHTDVVPIDGQQWQTDPFQLTRANDRLYGRGTADMKGFLAVILSLIPECMKNKRQHPIYFSFTYDEEVGCCGVPYLLADLEAANIRPQACIVGEPTELLPIVAHKGIHIYRCRVKGQAVHSSLTPKGCNAIEYAAKLICYIRNLAEELQHSGATDPHFDVPFSTITTNMTKGGSAHNIIPESCEFIFEFRHLPDMQPQTIIGPIQDYLQETLIPAMCQKNKNAMIEIEKISSVPAFETVENTRVLSVVRGITQKYEKRKVAYGTEAGLFQEAGIPTIVWGPGAIAQAHRENEYIEIAQLTQYETFLRAVLDHF